MNHFDDSEYERWSEGISASQTRGTQWGIEKFLGPNEKPQAGREDISIVSGETGDE